MSDFTRIHIRDRRNRRVSIRREAVLYLEDVESTSMVPWTVVHYIGGTWDVIELSMDVVEEALDVNNAGRAPTI